MLLISYLNMLIARGLEAGLIKLAVQSGARSARSSLARLEFHQAHARAGWLQDAQGRLNQTLSVMHRDKEYAI